MESNAKLSVVNLHRLNFVQSLRCGFNKQIYVINDKLFNNINGVPRLWFSMYGYRRETTEPNHRQWDHIKCKLFDNCYTIFQFNNVEWYRVPAAIWVIMNGKPQFSIFCPFSARTLGMENDKSCSMRWKPPGTTRNLSSLDQPSKMSLIVFWGNFEL